jgi:hypothetical protein
MPRSDVVVQHINLLTKHGTRKGFAWYAPRGVLLVLVALLAWTVNGEMHLNRLRQAQARTEQSIVDLKVTLERERREAGLQDLEVINAQIAALRTQLDARRGWLQLLQKGELGTPQGYAWVLQALAQTHEDGLWLRRVEMVKGGQSMGIEGNALDPDAVMHYADQLNQSFKSMGVQFSYMEMAQDAQDAAAANTAAAGVLKFKIY